MNFDETIDEFERHRKEDRKFYRGKKWNKAQQKVLCDHNRSPVDHPKYPYGYCIKCGIPYQKKREQD